MSQPLPEKPELDAHRGMSTEERMAVLKQHIERVEAQNEALQQRLEEAEDKNEELESTIWQLKRRNSMLKNRSEKVATIQEVIEKESSKPGDVILKEHGSNNEVLASVAASVWDEVEAGQRVAISDGYTIENVLETETDARAQAMEVNHQPSVTYTDIGGLDEEIKEVREAVEQPLAGSGDFDEVGIEPPSGVLMYGPPGTGKTMLAKAVANEVDATFIRLAASELVRKFIGEGANLVRDLFELADEEAPSVIFIDEIDAIASERTVSKTSGDQEVQRTLMQLLSNMDGFDDRGDIRIMAATNRYDRLDSAILRPGRFDRRIKIGLPDEEAREQVFKIHTRDMNLAEEIDFGRLAERSSGFTGADVAHTATEAGMCAVRDEREQITAEDFEEALERVREDVEADDEGKIRYAY